MVKIRKWLRLRRLVPIVALTVLIIGGYTWLMSYLAWQGDVRATRSLEEISPPGAGDRVLVVAPHPDDETLGCAGVIQQALARGAEVHVVTMTNGDASELSLIFGERELPWNAKAFIALGRKRQAESMRVLSSLGLPERCASFLGFPNNGLTALWRPEHWPYSHLYRSPRTGVTLSPYAHTLTPHAPYCGQQVLSDLMAMLQQVRPNIIFVTHPQDIHPDHWATCCFLRYALETIAVRGGDWARRVNVYGYLVHWPRYPAPRRVAPKLGILPPAELAGHDHAWVRLPLSSQEEQRKLRAIRTYHSQEPAVDRLMLAFVRSDEVFELLPTVTTNIGAWQMWRDHERHRRGLGGAEVAELRLEVTPARIMRVMLVSATPPLVPGAYIAVDVRGWDHHAAPVITTVYVGPGGRARAIRLNATEMPGVSVSTRRLAPGCLEIAEIPLSQDIASLSDLFVSCWGSVADRVTDPAVVSPVRLLGPGENPPAR
jgi:LmbE family N-acetylglucosaminyl deacetylase